MNFYVLWRYMLMWFFHHAFSFTREDSGAAQNVIDLFLVAKREQRSFGARCPSAALSDVRLWGHVSGFAAWPYVSRSLLAAPEEGHDLRSGAIRVGAECGVGGSLGDVLLDRPQYRISISSSRHIK